MLEGILERILEGDIRGDIRRIREDIWPPAVRSAARSIGVLRKRKANAPPGTTPTNLGDAFFRPVPLVLARLSQALPK